jgi:hypothetical protein
VSEYYHSVPKEVPKIIRKKDAEIARLREKIEQMSVIGDILAALVDLSHERQHPAYRRWQALRRDTHL